MTARSNIASRALRGGASTLVIGAMIFAPAAYAQTTSTTTEQAEETKPISTQTDPDAAAVPTDDPGAIVVTGQRRALRNAQQIKRNAETVVDSITATDIGSFPDKSIAEALQRVPGITVNRFAATGDTAHFSAEPSGVIVRGLPQVRSEFNGRDTFSANSSRGLSWSDVTPELMAGVDTYKNQTADLIEGGIAGSINLRTRVPFDATGQLFQVGANLNYNDLAKKWTPDANVFYSNRWGTGFGEVGIMANAAFSKVKTASEGIQYGRAGVFDNVFPESGFSTIYAPSAVSFRDNVYDRKRTGIAAAVQWKSLDDRLLFTGQFNRSVYKSSWDERVASVGFFDLFGQVATYRFNPTNNPMASGTRQFPRRAPGSAPFTFDDDAWLTGGTFANYSGWFGPPGEVAGFGVNSSGRPMFQACYTWGCPTGGQPGTYGAGVGTASRFNENRNMTQDFSANLKWEATDRLRFNFDAQRVNSTIDNYDIEVDMNSFANVAAEFDGRPTITGFSAPTHVNQSPGGLGNPNNYYIRAVMDHLEDSKGRQYAFRADGEYDVNTNWVDSIKFGARTANRKQKVQWSTYNWHNVANTWTDYSPCAHPFFNVDSTPEQCVRPGQATVDFRGYPSNFYEVSPFGTQFHGGNIGDFVFVPAEFLADGRASEFSSDRTGVGSFVPICERNGQRTPGGDTIATELPDSCFTEDEISDVSEKTKAVYAMLRFGGPDAMLGSVSVSGNIGLRYVRTTNESRGFTRFPNAVTNTNCPTVPLVPGGLTGTRTTPPTSQPGAFAPWPVECYLSGEDLAFASGAGTGIESTVKVNHRNLLPSFNLRFNLDPKWVLRLAASKAMSRPDIGQLKNFISISQGRPSNLPTDPRWIIQNGQPVGVNPTYTATAFNPYLKPITAWQFDVSLENYFANVGSFSAALFHKRFQNYIQQGSFDIPFTNNNVTRVVTVRGPANGKGAKISGAEVAYTRFFDFLPDPFNGIGIQANATYIKNKGIPNSGLSSVGSPITDGGGFTNGTILNPGSLEGLSKYAYNLVGLYEKGPINARLAYNWRSKYLVTTVDCCVALPVWQNAAGFLDGSVRYTLSQATELSFQVSNILKTQTVLKQQVTDEDSPEGENILVPNAWFKNDRRFTFGVRFKMGK